MSSIVALVFASLTFSTSTGLVGTLSVGDTGERAQLTYQAPETGSPVVAEILVSDYDLCASHRAGVRVYVNGQMQMASKLTPSGHFGITLQPGDELVVEAGAVQVHPTIRCVELGSAEITVATVDIR